MSKSEVVSYGLIRLGKWVYWLKQCCAMFALPKLVPLCEPTLHMISIVAHLTWVQFYSLFQWVVSLPHSLPGEKYLRQLKQKKKKSVSCWVKNMFIRHIIFFIWIKPAASFSDLGWIPLAPSPLDLSGSGAVYSDGCSDFFITCPGRSLCLLFLFLAPWKICISFELLWLQF